MKTIIGSALGILVLGAVLMAAGFITQTRSGGDRAAARQQAVQPQALAPQDASAQAEPVAYDQPMSSTNPMLVSCEAGQRALVRQVVMNGRLLPQVDCVGAVAEATAPVYGRTVSDMQVVPTVYGGQRTIAPERVVSREAPRRQTVVRTSRGWKKPVLIIGGSTAAAAGIGGLIGGKKGALIGAALGGGASTIYEATRK